MAETLTYTGTLVVVTCWCGMAHAVPEDLRDKQERDHANGREQIQIYCPLGHTYIIAGPGRADKLEAQRDRAKAEAAYRAAEPFILSDHQAALAEKDAEIERLKAISDAHATAAEARRESNIRANTRAEKAEAALQDRDAQLRERLEDQREKEKLCDGTYSLGVVRGLTMALDILDESAATLASTQPEGEAVRTHGSESVREGWDELGLWLFRTDHRWDGWQQFDGPAHLVDTIEDGRFEVRQFVPAFEPEGEADPDPHCGKPTGNRCEGCDREQRVGDEGWESRDMLDWCPDCFTAEGEAGKARSRSDLEDALRETFAECQREPETIWVAALWDRLYPGEPLEVVATYLSIKGTGTTPPTQGCLVCGKPGPTDVEGPVIVWFACGHRTRPAFGRYADGPPTADEIEAGIATPPTQEREETRDA